VRAVTRTHAHTRAQATTLERAKLEIAVLSNTHSASTAEVRDLTLGKYQVRYRVMRMGTYCVRLFYDGVEHKDSPWMCFSSGGQTDPAACATSLSFKAGRQLVAEAGEEIAFFIFAKDRYGQRRLEGGDRFDVSLINGLTAEEMIALHSRLDAAGPKYTRQPRPEDIAKPLVVDNGDGSYSVRCKIFRVGMYQVDISNNQQTIHGSGFKIHVKPSGLAIQHTKLYARGEDTLIAGEPAFLEFELYDAYNNILELPDVDVDLKIRGRGKTRIVLHELPEGRYRCEYAILQRGLFQVLVTVNGLVIPGCPINVVVRPTSIDPSQTKVHIATLRKSITCGVPCKFNIDTLDALGNFLEVGGFIFEGEVRETSTENVTEEPARVPVAWTDYADGTYQGEFTLTRATDYLLSITSGGQHVPGSPFTFEAEAGPADAPQCEIWEADGGLVTSRCGDWKELHLISRDHWRNEIFSAGTQYKVMMLAITNGSVSAEIKIENKDDGEVIIRYCCTVADTYRLSVQLRTLGVLVDVPGTPVDIPVTPTDCTLSTIFGSGSGLVDGSVGEDHNVCIQINDKYRNPTHLDGDQIICRVEGPPRTSVQPTEVQQVAPGLWRFSYSTFTAGEYFVHIDISGLGSIQGSPFKVNQHPGRLHAPACYVPAGIAPTKAGERSAFVIQTRDVFENNLKVGGAKLTCHISSMPGMPESRPKVIDHGNGTYEVKWRLHVIGTYAVDLRIDSRWPILGSPYLAQVLPALPDPNESYAYGTALFACAVQQWSRFMIQSCDRFGNKADTRTDNYNVEFVDGPTDVEVVIESKGNGQYEARFFAKFTGRYKVHVVLNGRPVRGSPYAMQADAKVKRKIALRMEALNQRIIHGDSEGQIESDEDEAESSDEDVIDKAASYFKTAVSDFKDKVRETLLKRALAKQRAKKKTLLEERERLTADLVVAKQSDPHLVRDPREAVLPMLMKTKREKVADMQRSIQSLSEASLNDDLLIWSGVRALTEQLNSQCDELPVAPQFAVQMGFYSKAPEIIIPENAAIVEQQKQQVQEISALEAHRAADALKLRAARSADATSEMGTNVVKQVSDLDVAEFGGMTLKYNAAERLVGSILGTQGDDVESIQKLRTTEHLAGLSHLAYLRQLSQSRRSIAQRREA
jgi:hypothetical protein